MVFFGISTVVGVPLLSSFQIVQIKGSNYADWASTLGASLGPATGIFILISIASYFMLKPLMQTIKEANSRDLSIEEHHKARNILKKVNLISIISIMIGYPIGNGATIVLKTLKGKVNYNLTDILIILVLIFCYALMAIQYSVVCFNSMARKEMSKLKIHSTEGFKKSSFIRSLIFTFLTIAITISWHMFCCAYSSVRHDWTMEEFKKKAIIAFMMSFTITTPLLYLILRQLKIRFSLTIQQIESLRSEGDLVTRLNLGTFDDFGEVMTEMNLLMDFLKDSLTTLKYEANHVDNDAMELLQVTEKSTTGMTQIVESFSQMNTENNQTENLLEKARININKLNEDANQVSNFMEEQSAQEVTNAKSITDMYNNFHVISEMTNKAQNLSVELTKASSSGSNEVQRTQSIMTEISDKARRMIETVSMIEKVATQTNLLAMNAAIEASHAGEAGKGFSVVAGEIRSLSVSTQNSAKQIGELITEMANATEAGTQHMNDTRHVFDSILNGIEEQTKLVEEISKTVNQQSNQASIVLEKTKEAVEKSSDANKLIKNQANYTKEIKNGIDTIVDLSMKVAQSMKESERVVKDFSNSFSTVKEKAELNRASVSTITDELNKFNM